MNNSVDAPRLSSEDYAKYGIETMGWFNWNLPKMSLDANHLWCYRRAEESLSIHDGVYDDLGIYGMGQSVSSRVLL